MIHKYLVAGALIGAASFPAAGQSVRAGIEAWQHTQYADAVAIWRPLAEKGDADAAFNLGQAYRLGRGVPTNLAAAQTWFERAARKGHSDAQTTLGLMLFENGDRAGGVRWLRQAAQKNEPRAMLVYGTALFNGDGVKQDPLLGYAYVNRAAAQGLPPAQATLEQLDQILPEPQKRIARTLKVGAAPTTRVASASVPKRQPTAAAPVQVAAARPAKATPAPPSPALATPKSAVNGGWRIQLGAFTQRTTAEALFRRLSNSLAGHQPFFMAAGPVTRLQVGPYPSRPAATAACAALRGQPCFPVPPR